MAQFAFNWSIVGTTIVEADSFLEAEGQFEAISMAQLTQQDASDCCTEEFGVIGEHGEFLERDRGELQAEFPIKENANG